MRVQLRKRSRRAAVAGAAMLLATSAQGVFGAAGANEHDDLFLNAGPVPSGVRAGVPQTVFQFLKAGSPDGAPVAGQVVNFRVVAGPNAGQEGELATDANGLAIWRFDTDASYPTGGTDTVTSWVDLNGDEQPNDGEPANTNPFFTLPAENLPPTAAVVRVEGLQGQALGVQLEGTDPDGRFLSYRIDTPPAHGDAVLAPASSYVSYVPDVGFAGTDSFTYLVRDDAGATAQGTVVVTIEENPPAAPVIETEVLLGCDEMKPTLVVPAGQRVAFGTGGNDVILVQGEGVTVYGRDGDDTICLGGGNNAVYGSGGNDSIFLGNGDNIVYAGDGDDTVKTGDGDNRLYGSGGNDDLVAGSGANYLYGEDGDDLLSVTGDVGIMSGGNGNDRLVAPATRVDRYGLYNTGYQVWGGHGDDDFLVAGKEWRA